MSEEANDNLAAVSAKDKVESLRRLVLQGRRRWRGVILLQAAGLAVAGPLAYLWLVFLIDNVVHLDRAGRLVASTVFFLGLAGLVWMIFVVVKFPSWHAAVKFYIPLALLFAGALWFSWIRIQRRSQRYKITNLNIEYENGVFNKTIQNLEMWRIDDIVFHQTLSERMLGISRVELITRDKTTPVLVLEGLPPGRRIFDDVKQAFLLAKQRKNIVGFVD